MCRLSSMRTIFPFLKKKIKMPKKLLCPLCKKRVKRFNRKQRYCELCREELKRRSPSWEWRKKFKMPATMICSICKNKISRNSPTQKYCVKCSLKVQRKSRKDYFKKNYAMRKEMEKIYSREEIIDDVFDKVKDNVWKT